MDARESFGAMLGTLTRSASCRSGIRAHGYAFRCLWLNVKHHCPNRLYKYFSDQNIDRTISDLRAGRLYLADPRDFNDEFDARPQYDEKQIVKRLQCRITEKNMNATIQRVGQFHPELVDDVRRSVHFSYAKCGGFESWKQQHIQSTVEHLGDKTTRFRSLPRCACLSETYTSGLMWGTYASSNKGIVVAYETPRQPPSLCCSTCIDGRDGLCARARINLIPVQYSARPDLTHYSDVVGGSLWEVPYLTEHEYLAVITAVASKSVEWEHEKEWRLVCIKCPKINSGAMHAKMNPVALYLGSNVSNNNRAALTHVAQELGIDLFEEVVGYSVDGPNMSFKKVNIA